MQEVRQRQKNIFKDKQRPKFWLKSEGKRKHTRLRSRHKCPGKSVEMLSEQAGIKLVRAWRTTSKAPAGISSARERLGSTLACCWMIHGTWWQRTQKRLTSFTSVFNNKAFRNSRPLQLLWKFRDKKYYPWLTMIRLETFKPTGLVRAHGNLFGYTPKFWGNWLM